MTIIDFIVSAFTGIERLDMDGFAKEELINNGIKTLSDARNSSRKSLIWGTNVSSSTINKLDKALKRKGYGGLK